MRRGFSPVAASREAREEEGKRRRNVVKEIEETEKLSEEMSKRNQEK